MRAAQKLLGVPTIGRGSAQAEDGGGGSQSSCPFWLINRHSNFCSKVLNRIYSRDVF